MYMCMTEEMKKMIVGNSGIMLIEYKRIIKRIVDVLKELANQLAEIFCSVIKLCVDSFNKFGARLRYVCPKERYKRMRMLSKCGFSEKEVNVMVHQSIARCRNNC